MTNLLSEFLLRVLAGMFFGAVLGSFITMLTYRLPRGKSIVAPRSFCPTCQKKIDWKDMVPVYSYVQLKGLCRNCGKPYGKTYFVTEVISVVALTLIVLIYGFSFQAFMLGCIFATLYTVGGILDRQGKDKDIK